MSLVYYQRNRYSVPTAFAHHIVSLRIYPTEVAVVVSEHREIARRVRRFERYQISLQLAALPPGPRAQTRRTA